MSFMTNNLANHTLEKSISFRSFVQEQSNAFLVAQFSLLVSAHVDLNQFTSQIGMDEGSTTRLGRRGNAYSENVEILPLVGELWGSPVQTLNHFEVWLAALSLRIVDKAQKMGLHLNTCPLCSFANNFRNAIAHDGVWKWGRRRGDPGAFQDFVLTSEHLGHSALYKPASSSSEFSLMPGDVFTFWKVYGDHFISDHADDHK